MRLVVVSHKLCWRSPGSPSGFATDGGFPFQMSALSELFDTTTIAVPCDSRNPAGEIPLTGRQLRVVPLTNPGGSDFRRKIRLPWWLARNLVSLTREIRHADAVHVPVPGDIGTIGMIVAVLLRKPLCVRHCGNWFVQATVAERFWRWFMERFAGGRNVMLATGGAADPPSARNGATRWMFSTTLSERELASLPRRNGLPEPAEAQLIIACRQEAGKGTEALIEALPLIIRKCPRSRLHVVGSGGAMPGLRRLVTTLGLDDHVVFHGAVDHAAVMRLLVSADLFCYPTASEGFPKVVLEAMACGLPVITSPVSVLPQLVGRDCGVLIDHPTPRAIAEAVLGCLSDLDRYRGMSVRATETARQYSLERWRDAMGDILRAAWGPLRSDA